ncbi:MAG TPA: hypothetical protein VI298_05310 [Geobacteraceae bacterium]
MMRNSLKNRIIQFFNRLFVPDLTSTCDADKISAVYKEVFKQCPVCKQDIAGHAFWRLASAMVDQSSGTADMLADLVSKRCWKEAAQVAQWAYDKDVREYYAIRCSESGSIGLLVVMFTHGFYSNDEVENVIELTKEDENEILAIADDQWELL